MFFHQTFTSFGHFVTGRFVRVPNKRILPINTRTEITISGPLALTRKDDLHTGVIENTCKTSSITYESVIVFDTYLLLLYTKNNSPLKGQFTN
jgi:hypothetical protein